MPKAQSKSRGYFDRIDGESNKVRCKLCSFVLTTGGGTSNMLAHLKRKHPDIMSNARTDTTADQNDSTSNTSSVSTCPVLHSKKLDQALTLMLATDFQPFSIVGDKGFIRFVWLLNPNYKIPDKRTIRYELLPQLFHEAKAKLKLILSETVFLSLTTDIWTSTSMDSYITITTHFFYKDKLQSCVLTTKAIQESHTAENLRDIVLDILTEWEIRDKIVCITTDNGANMIKMARLLGIRSMPCFAHTLNLVVEDSLKVPELIILIEKCKKIVKYFRKSNIATITLQREQKERNPDVAPLQLIQEVPTRWNSVYYMINRLLKLIDSLTAAQRKLPQAPPIITPEEEKTLKDVVLLLDVFEQATQMISAEQYPTSSLIIPIIYGLYDNIRSLEPRLSTVVGETFLQCLRDSMNQRLLNYETRTVCRLSTILHPTFRNSFRLLENKIAAKEGIKAEINNILRVRRASQNTSEESLEMPSTSGSNRPSLLGFLKTNNNTFYSGTSSAAAINILKMYMETDFSDINHNWDNVVEFWKFNKHLKPLDEIAFKYLTVPATSVKSERVFSATGYILNLRRSMLRNDAVEMLCFLNQNYNFLE